MSVSTLLPQPAHRPPRPLRGSRMTHFYPPVPDNGPSLAHIESAFQLQEYISLMIRKDPHDVEAIVSLPRVRGGSTFLPPAGASGSGNAGDERKGDEAEKSEEGEGRVENVDEACWIYEQLRRLAQDLTQPLITSLQQECTRASCPEMKAGDWLYLCVAHGNDGAMEQCCAIDYILHTLDSATALLNSPRTFPSRIAIPPSSTRQFTSLARRLGRIFAHAFFHHREAFEQAEAESSLYTRFLALTSRFGLVPPEFLVIPPLATGHGASTSAAGEENGERERSEGGEHAGAGLGTGMLPILVGQHHQNQHQANQQQSNAHLHEQYASQRATQPELRPLDVTTLHVDPSLGGSSPASAGSSGGSDNNSPRRVGRNRTDTMVYSDGYHIAEELRNANSSNSPGSGGVTSLPSPRDRTVQAILSHSSHSGHSGHGLGQSVHGNGSSNRSPHRSPLNRSHALLSPSSPISDHFQAADDDAALALQQAHDGIGSVEVDGKPVDLRLFLGLGEEDGDDRDDNDNDGDLDGDLDVDLDMRDDEGLGVGEIEFDDDGDDRGGTIRGVRRRRRVRVDEEVEDEGERPPSPPLPSMSPRVQPIPSMSPRLQGIPSMSPRLQPQISGMGMGGMGSPNLNPFASPIPSPRRGGIALGVGPPTSAISAVSGASGVIVGGGKSKEVEKEKEIEMDLDVEMPNVHLSTSATQPLSSRESVSSAQSSSGTSEDDSGRNGTDRNGAQEHRQNEGGSPGRGTGSGDGGGGTNGGASARTLPDLKDLEILAESGDFCQVVEDGDGTSQQCSTRIPSSKTEDEAQATHTHPTVVQIEPADQGDHDERDNADDNQESPIEIGDGEEDEGEDVAEIEDETEGGEDAQQPAAGVEVPETQTVKVEQKAEKTEHEEESKQSDVKVKEVVKDDGVGNKTLEEDLVEVEKVLDSD